MVKDIVEADFQNAVVERSTEVPVVVDFWAEWCGPCRQLGPVLEAEAAKRDGDIDLVKIDVDSNQGLSQRFGVQGIPAVKAFKDGEVAAEFTGALPPAQVAAFFDRLAPSEADRLAHSDDEADLRRALELDPRQAEAARKLARKLLGRGEQDEVGELLAPLAGDFGADGLVARAELAGVAEGRLAEAFSAWDAGRHAEALEALQEVIADCEDSDRRDQLRRVMVSIFTEVGTGSELAREHRRKLALVLS
ncbi:MAG: tetratricopeptide repeat protein [Solirubrobacterales bacterium]